MISALTPSVRIISNRDVGRRRRDPLRSLARASSADMLSQPDGVVVDDEAPAAVLLRLDPPRRPVAEVAVHPLVPEVVRLVDVGVGRDLRELRSVHVVLLAGDQSGRAKLSSWPSGSRTWK